MSENQVANPGKSNEKSGKAEPEEPGPTEKHRGYEEEKASAEEVEQIEESSVVKKPPEGSFSADVQIGEVIRICPEAEGVLEKYFGACAKCPAILAETIDFQASIHDVDLKSVLDELNKLR